MKCTAVVIGILSFFRYITFNPRMSILWLTIQRAGGDLVTFLVFFAIVFMAFVFFAIFVYGSQMFEYSEWQWALISSLRGVFGDIDYDSMFLVQHNITPIVCCYLTICYHLPRIASRLFFFACLNMQYFFAFTIVIIFILVCFFHSPHTFTIS